MQKYMEEFPDFDAVLPTLEGWEDVSWHNDICPSLEHVLEGGMILRLWVDYYDPEKREMDQQRYSLVLCDKEGAFVSTIVEADTWPELEVALCKVGLKGRVGDMMIEAGRRAVA